VAPRLLRPALEGVRRVPRCSEHHRPELDPGRHDLCTFRWGLPSGSRPREANSRDSDRLRSGLLVDSRSARWRTSLDGREDSTQRGSTVSRRWIKRLVMRRDFEGTQQTDARDRM